MIGSDGVLEHNHGVWKDFAALVACIGYWGVARFSAPRQEYVCIIANGYNCYITFVRISRLLSMQLM